MSAAEVLAQHRKSWTVQSGVATCTAPGCGWSKFGTLTQTDVAFAAHQLDALKAAGYAAVELPQRVGGHWPVDPHDEFSVWRISLRRDSDGAYVNGAQVDWGSMQFNLSGEHARALAAALLAAAEVDR